MIKKMDFINSVKSVVVLAIQNCLQLAELKLKKNMSFQKRTSLEKLATAII